MEAKSISIGLRKASALDLPAIMTILSDGRRTQRASGFRQWEDGYPSCEVLEADVESGRGYMLTVDGGAAGYACLVVDDPDYFPVEHCFRLSGRFVVIHRLAMARAFCGRGLARLFLGLLEDEARLLGAKVSRVDTAYENKVMQHLMEILGYDCLGHTEYCWGVRLTYEKSI